MPGELRELKAVSSFPSPEKVFKDVAERTQVLVNETVSSNKNEERDEELPRDIFDIDLNPVDSLVDNVFERAFKRPKTKDSHLSLARITGSLWNSHNM